MGAFLVSRLGGLDPCCRDRGQNRRFRSVALKLVHYNLAGVHPDFSGRGFYTALAADGMRMTQSFARYLDGPVHVSNYPVHRALQKLGWKIAGARHSFHKWLKA